MTPDQEPAQDWYFTFGGGHQLKVARSDGTINGSGVSLVNRYVKINGTFMSARQIIISLFGDAWSNQYNATAGPEMIREYELIELVL